MLEFIYIYCHNLNVVGIHLQQQVILYVINCFEIDYFVADMQLEIIINVSIWSAQVIPAFEEAVAGMSLGGIRRWSAFL